MGTINSSETRSEVDYLRSMRTTTQAEVDEMTRRRDAEDLPAEVRWSSLTH